MERKKLNNEVKKIFTQNTFNNLKVFFDYLDSLKADIIILMARKAICLFELPDYLPFKKPTAEIVSDRVLDLDINYLKNKKVIIVDDTLIVGSSLNKIKEYLTKEKIEFKIVVFCVDEDNWQKKLIMPDYIQEHFSSREVLDFCINEVKTFSLISKPYLVDFPVTNFIQLKYEELQCILSDNRYSCIPLPTQNNTSINSKYTVLLKDSIKEKYYLSIGSGFRNIIETMKLRLFISNDDESINLCIVPIVLLKPIKESEINYIFEHLISHSEYKKDFQEFINKTSSQIRFIQYYLSIMLGKVFFANFGNIIARIDDLHFKSTEIINLFGKELGKKFEQFSFSEKNNPLDINIFPSEIITEKIFTDILNTIKIKGYNIVESFQNVFVEMFNVIEIPARLEIKEGHYSNEHMQRLKNGIAFNTIVNHFTKKLNIEINESVIEYFSLCLDIANDLGISVPIICKYNDIYYRGFRYGELGKRTPGNIYLFFLFLENFCQSSNIDISKGLNHLLIEKLAVLFFRIAGRKEFIDITYNNSDPDAFNMGFYLMGAVMINNSEDFFPTKRNEWFLNSCCSNLLEYHSKSKKYYLKQIPKKEGLSLKNGAEDESMYLGLTVGKIFYPKNVGNSDKSFALDDDSLTILVSCYSAGDLAMAIAAELNIIISWVSIAKYCLKKTNNFINHSLFTDFHTTTIYQSFNQAFFKINSSFGPYTNVQKIISNTKYYLKNNFEPIYAKHWDDYLRNLKVGKEDVFSIEKDNDKLIVKHVFDAANKILMLGNYFHYIRFLIEVNKNKYNPTVSMNSIFSFVDIKSNREYKRKIVDKFIKDENIVKGFELGYRSKIAQAFINKKTNDTLVIKYGKREWEFKITDIDNTLVTY